MDPRLQQVYDQLNTVYNPQRDLINQQIAQIPGMFNAERQGLEQAKVNAFRDITTQSNRNGMFFSGFRPEEEARYTGTKYLPALADVGRRQQERQFSLQDALNKVHQTQFGQAQTSLQAILDREAEERRYQQQRADQAAQAARSRGGGGGGRSGGGGGGPSQQEQFAAALAGAAGKDGKVSPGDYNALKNQWVAAGYGDYKAFHDKFWRFANNQHWWDYYY